MKVIANLCNNKIHSLGCFSRFLRRILCSKTRKTYPLKHDRQRQCSTIDSVIDGSTPPNDQKDWNLINSKDFREKTEEIQGKCSKIVKNPSFSFSETDDIFDVEDDDNFIVLSFDNEIRKIEGNSEVGFENNEENYRKKNGDKQGRNRVFPEEVMFSLEKNVDFSEENYDVSRFEHEITSIGCYLGSFSPNSVLDDGEFISEIQVFTSINLEEEDMISRGYGTNTRELSTSRNESSIENERQIQENEDINIRLKSKTLKHKSIRLLREVCNLGKEDIASKFGQLIFDQLVIEVVDQLVELAISRYK